MTDDEKLARAAQLKRAIAADRYPLSPRVPTLKAILVKLESEAIGVRELLKDCGARDVPAQLWPR